MKGAFGGYVGGLIAAHAVSFLYYWEWLQTFNALKWAIVPPEPLGRITLEITVAATLVGCILGFLTLCFARISLTSSGFKLARDHSPLRTLLGTGVGGALTGALCVPWMMWIFGRMERPIMSPDLLLPGAILGAAIFIFSIVNFDFERLSMRRLRAGALAAMIAVFMGGLATAAVFGPLYFLGIVTIVIEWLENHFDDPVVIITGSVMYGVPVGVVLGMVIGIAVILTQRWSGKNIFQVG